MKKFLGISNSIKNFDSLNLMKSIKNSLNISNEIISESIFPWSYRYELKLDDKDSKIELYSQNSYINLRYTLYLSEYVFCNISLSKKTLHIKLVSQEEYPRKNREDCVYTHYFEEEDILSIEQIYSLFIDMHYGMMFNIKNINNIITNTIKQVEKISAKKYL